MFLWLVMHDSLQTNSHRFKCNLAEAPNCSRCSATEEDVIHCMRDCPHSRELWQRAGVVAWPGFMDPDCGNWVRRHATGRNGTRFVASLWGIWKWRNNMVFEEAPWTIDEAWRRLCHEHDEIARFMNGEEELEEIGLMSRRWLPPPRGTVNLCIDGSYNPETKIMGSGGLIRDDQGRWMCGFHSFMTGGSALLSEARALKAGLQVAWDRGYRKVIGNMDCSDLLQALGDGETCQFFPILDAINELRTRTWTVELEVIRREYNAPADWLARKGASTPDMDLCILEEPTSDLEILVLRDRLAIT